MRSKKEADNQMFHGLIFSLNMQSVLVLRYKYMCFSVDVL